MHPAFLYRCSSTITAAFPSPFVATIYKSFLLYLGFPALPLFPLSFFPLHFPSFPAASAADDFKEVFYAGGSVAEWLACWTQAQKGPGSNRSRNWV